MLDENFWPSSFREPLCEKLSTDHVQTICLMKPKNTESASGWLSPWQPEQMLLFLSASCNGAGFYELLIQLFFRSSIKRTVLFFFFFVFITRKIIFSLINAGPSLGLGERPRNMAFLEAQGPLRCFAGQAHPELAMSPEARRLSSPLLSFLLIWKV